MDSEPSLHIVEKTKVLSCFINGDHIFTEREREGQRGKGGREGKGEKGIEKRETQCDNLQYSKAAQSEEKSNSH